MAVYTQLDEVALQALWSVYDDEAALVRAEGIAQGSINTTYRLETEAGVFYLRINEDKESDDVWYEAELLDHLAAARLDVVTPTIKRTRIGGRFFHVEERSGRPVWAAIFPLLPGRDLGVFEVTPAHTAQVGRFMARAHRTLRSFRGSAPRGIGRLHAGRANPYGAGVVARWLDDLVRDEGTHDVAVRLERTLARARTRRALLPRGVVHGDLFVDNSKWTQGTLAAVFDWEMAGRDHLALDLVIALHAWCWVSGAFDGARCRGLVEGYERERALAPSERRGLFTEALIAAVRFTSSRMRDFEVPKPGRDRAARAFLDYRDFLARLDALEGLGERGFLRMVGL